MPNRNQLCNEIKAELDRDHAELESSCRVYLEKLIDQNPQLMNLKVEAINKIEISLTLGYLPLKGILLEYLQKEKSRIYQDFCSQIENIIGRPYSLDEDETVPPLTLPLSEIDRLDRLWDENRIEMVKKIRHCFLKNIRKYIPEAQTIRPYIQIRLYLPDHRGSQMFIYEESKGNVLLNKVIKPPTVTLDTNVLREYWNNRDRMEYVKKLLEFGKMKKIDLAVTDRIRNDIPRLPLANKINEIPNLGVINIGSVIRFGHWRVGLDVAGNDKFKDFFNSPAVVKKLNRMNKNRQPDYRDQDHLHTHYRYKRDYFLTWDSGILHFAYELQEKLGIIVMKPDTFCVDKLPHIRPHIRNG